eukprot:SAG11_NODE_32720_length_281_cov_0.857143_1_plen_93_part_11
MGREMSQGHAFEAESPRNSELVPTAAGTVFERDVMVKDRGSSSTRSSGRLRLVNTAANVLPSTVMGREMSQGHAFEAESPRNSELVPTAAGTV